MPRTPASSRSSLRIEASSVRPKASSEACSRLRIWRVATRIWCTASSASARTARSHSSSAAICSATARCTGSDGGSGRAARHRPALWPASSRARRAARRRRADGWSAGQQAAGLVDPASTSSSSHSRQRCSSSARRRSGSSRQAVTVVIAELGQRGAVVAVDHGDVAGGGRSGRPESAGGPGRWPAPRRAIRRAPRRRPARARGSRCAPRPAGQLQMPALVGAAGAPAQRDPIGGQVSAGGVVVDRLQVPVVGIRSLRDGAGEAVEGRRTRCRTGRRERRTSVPARPARVEPLGLAHAGQRSHTEVNGLLEAVLLGREGAGGDLVGVLGRRRGATRRRRHRNA